MEYLMPGAILGTGNTTQNPCSCEPEKHEQMKQDVLKCDKIMIILEFILSIRIMIPPSATSMSSSYSHLKLTF